MRASRSTRSFFTLPFSLPLLFSLHLLVSLLLPRLASSFSTGVPISSSPTAFSSSLVEPWGLLYDGASLLYVTDQGTDSVVQLSLSGQVLASFTFLSNSSVALYHPTGLAIDPAGGLYVADAGNSRVVKFTSNGSVVQQFTTSPSLSFPEGVAVDSAFHVYVADTANQRVVQLRADGSVAAIFSVPSVLYPSAIVVDALGSLYLSDTFSSVVVRRAADGSSSVLLSAVSEPTGLALSPSGDLFVADSGDDRILRIAAQTGTVLEIFDASPALQEPIGLALDSQGTLYVAVYEGREVVAFAGATAAQSSTAAPVTPHATSTPAPTASAATSAPAAALATASLCYAAYGLPGNIDYPWSVALHVTFQYAPVAVSTPRGLAVQVVSAQGSRVFTNRFASAFTSAVTLAGTTTNLLYLGGGTAVDGSGLSFAVSPTVQLPGAGPSNVFSIIDLRLSSSGAVVESGASRVDPQGTVVQASVPGFVNTTIGASNINALTVNYATCRAPIQFTNGLRTPTQPSASNGGVHLTYGYTIGDGVTYTVQTALTLTTSSAFATMHDLLGNPYQQVTAITGTRTYTYLPTGAQVVSQVSFTPGTTPTRFYPYVLLASGPGVYTQDTAPYLDADGLTFSIAPAAPSNGAAPGAGTQLGLVTVHVVTYNNTATQLNEAVYVTQPLPTLQRQVYTIIA